MPSTGKSRERLVLGALAVLLLALVVAILWHQRGARVTGPGGASPADGGPAAPGPKRAAGSSTFTVPPADALRLVGLVVDAHGAPVAGAGVLLSGETTRTTASDGAGAFIFEGLWAGPYLVEAWAGEASGGPLRVHLVRDTPRVIVRLFEAARLTIKVVSARDQAPLADAAVELRALGMLRNGVTIRKGTTDKNGALELRGVPPGGYMVAASAKGHRMAAINLEPAAGLRWETTVTLKPGSEVHARVVDEGGKPVEGAVVWATPFVGFEAAQISRPPAFDFTARSDAKGEVTVTAPKGRHRLMVDHERFILAWSAPFDCDGTNPVSGVTARLQRGGVIAGTVVTVLRQPVPRARVRISPTDNQVGGGAMRQLVCDADGRFEIAGVPLTGMELAAFADGASSETYAIDLKEKREQRDLVVPLTLEGSIGGVVVSSSGAPLGDVHVQCVSYQREAINVREIAVETSDAAGRFACRGLRPGEYRVTAIPPGSNNMVQAAMRGVGADAQTGEDELRLVIRDDGSLSGKVQLPDGRPATSFRLDLVDGMRGRTFKSADGSFRVAGVPPTTFNLKVTVEGYPPKRLAARVTERENADVGVITVDREGTPEAKPLQFPSGREYVPPPAPVPPPSGPSGEAGAGGGGAGPTGAQGGPAPPR